MPLRPENHFLVQPVLVDLIVIVGSVSHSVHSVMSDSLQPYGLLHTRPPCPWQTPRVYSNSCPLIWWCHPTVSSSVIPFFSHLQSFPASGSFQMNQFFASGGPSFGVSTSASVLPINIQDWFPLEWTGWISKGLSRVFSNTTVQKHQFFGAHSGGRYIQIESHSSLNTRLRAKNLKSFSWLNNLTELFKFHFLHLYNEYFGWDKVGQL